MNIRVLLSALSCLVLAGCASTLKLSVSNPYRDRFVDVTANGTPFVTNFAMGYESGEVRPVQGEELEIEATSYTLRGGVKTVIDWFRSIYKMNGKKEVRIKVEGDGSLNTTTSSPD